MDNCLPTKRNTSISCYSYNTLLKIATNYNKYYANKIIIERNKQKLWDNIKQKLETECKKEWCWKDQQILKNIKNHRNLDVFRPHMPKDWYTNINSWLDTNNINDVMKQYENKYNTFAYLGTVPSDCPEDIYCELTNVDYLKLKKKNIKKIGIIYNLDKHNQGGSHWVALFIDQTNNIPTIEYYDSYGTMPNNLIKKYIHSIKDNYNKNNINCHCIYNDRRHQYGGSECGMFSMFYIINRLNGISMDDITKEKIKDKEMEELRYKLYIYKEK